VVAGLLLNAMPVQGFYAYSVSVGYSTTLSSKKDIRNFLLLVGGLTLLGVGAYYLNKMVQEYNNRPPAPRPSASPAPAAKTPEQELQDIEAYTQRCHNKYDMLYGRLNKIVHDSNPGTLELASIAAEAQENYFKGIHTTHLCDMAKEHFNAQKPLVTDYQKDLAHDITKLTEYAQRFVFLGNTISAVRLVEASEFLNKTRQRLEVLQHFVVCRNPELDLYQQTERIEARYKDELSAAQERFGDASLADTIRKKVADRIGYKDDLQRDSDKFGKAVKKVADIVQPDRTQTDLYTEARDKAGYLSRIQSLAR
jgi:hypothetical protein